MRRFSVPSRGVSDFVVLLIALNVFLYWVSSTIDDRPELAGVDFLLWLLVPVVFTIAYLTLGRTWSSAGLRPKIRGQGYWFLFAVTLPIGLSALLLLANQLLGLVTLRSEQLSTGVMIGLAGLSGLFVKNIAEEFVFRGFLTGRLAQTVGAGLQSHLLTGVIWSFWHLVYWTVMLPEGKIAEVSGLPMLVFVMAAFAALSFQSVLLGELRLATGSIWAGVVLHTMNNAIFASLVAAQAVPLGDLRAALLTPIDIGLVYAGLMGLIGFMLWRRRLGIRSMTFEKYPSVG